MLVYQWINKIIKLYNIIGIMSRTLKLTMKCYKKKSKTQNAKTKEAQAGGGVPSDNKARASSSGKSRQLPADIRSLRRGWFKNLSRDRGGQAPKTSTA